MPRNWVDELLSLDPEAGHSNSWRCEVHFSYGKVRGADEQVRDVWEFERTMADEYVGLQDHRSLTDGDVAQNLAAGRIGKPAAPFLHPIVTAVGAKTYNGTRMRQVTHLDDDIFTEFTARHNDVLFPYRESIITSTVRRCLYRAGKKVRRLRIAAMPK